MIDTPGSLYYNINVCILIIKDPLAPDLSIEKPVIEIVKLRRFKLGKELNTVSV